MVGCDAVCGVTAERSAPRARSGHAVGSKLAAALLATTLPRRARHDDGRDQAAPARFACFNPAVKSPRHARPLAATGLTFVLLVDPTGPAAQPRQNYFDDPFVQATSALAGCPVPEGPLITLDEMRAQAHGRVDRGTTCFRSGRCRLPNAYLYDKEIVPRVRQFIAQDERFAGTSVWVLGQRRWVYLMGCVADAGQRDALERAVQGIDDVEAVINELMIGREEQPRYRTATSPP